MIRAIADGGFVISSGGTWLPGVYADKATARYAFQFSADTLQRLQDSVNPGGTITMAMLRAACS